MTKVELKVGTILNSEKVEKSDKLLKNTIKIGNETRTIVSGIAEHYKPVSQSREAIIASLELIKYSSFKWL